MDQDMFKNFMYGSVVLIILGLIFILASTNIGLWMSDSWLDSYINRFPEDDVDFSELELRSSTHIQQILVIGSILFFVGLMASFITLFKRFVK
ncbi:hypothetical protein NSQ54_05300 [Alkalihalobacillus sp. FSL W8-0930]